MKTELDLHEFINETADTALSHSHPVQYMARAFESLFECSILLTNAEHAALQAELAEANRKVEVRDAELSNMVDLVQERDAELTTLRALLAKVPVEALKESVRILCEEAINSFNDDEQNLSDYQTNCANDLRTFLAALAAYNEQEKK